MITKKFCNNIMFGQILVKQTIRDILIATSPGYRFFLKRAHGVSDPKSIPSAPWANAVLKTRDEVDQAIGQIREIGLPLRGDSPKNWDGLAALDCILKNTDKNAKIFDAGAELYSFILPWLFLYGYKNLYGGNLIFDRRVRRGPIIYDYCDITKTKFPKKYFDAITCMSVIEHGVDSKAYFIEMARILKPKGLLITSTDYWETPIDARGQSAHGVPIRIFSRDEIGDMLSIAKDCGFTLTSPLDLSPHEKVVHWKQYDLKYTFVIFTLRKN